MGVRVTETTEFDVNGGYLIDGFPSVGLASAIATESLIRTSNFAQVGTVDSNSLPHVCLVRDGMASHPANLFVNRDTRVCIFSSYLAVPEPAQHLVADAMLDWSKQRDISLVLSSIAIKSTDTGGVYGVASTKNALDRLASSGISTLSAGTIPGIPGMLLRGGLAAGRDVIVLLFHSSGDGPDYVAGIELCNAISKLIPGTSCDIAMLQNEAKKAQDGISRIGDESRRLRDSMYG